MIGVTPYEEDQGKPVQESKIKGDADDAAPYKEEEEKSDKDLEGKGDDSDVDDSILDTK